MLSSISYDSTCAPVREPLPTRMEASTLFLIAFHKFPLSRRKWVLCGPTSTHLVIYLGQQNAWSSCPLANRECGVQLGGTRSPAVGRQELAFSSENPQCSAACQVNGPLRNVLSASVAAGNAAKAKKLLHCGPVFVRVLDSARVSPNDLGLDIYRPRSTCGRPPRIKSAHFAITFRRII